MDRKGREKWRRSDKQQSIQFLLGGRCPSCLLTASHNNTSRCKYEAKAACACAHTNKHTHGTFKLITQLFLQRPTSHLVQWFGSGAFYKRRPEEHGEQVLHTHSVAAAGGLTLELIGLPLKLCTSAWDICLSFCLSSCRRLGTYSGKYWLRAGLGPASVPRHITLNFSSECSS